MKKRAKTENRIVRDILPGKDAKIRILRYNDGSAPMVRGYAIHSDTAVRVDQCGEHQHQASSNASVNSAVQYVVAAIKADCQQHEPVRSATDNPPNEEGPFRTAFEICNHQSLCSPNWGPSTRKKALKYFERQILPRFEHIGLDICDADLVEIKEDLVTRALENGRSNKNPDDANSSVSDELYRTNIIYHNLQLENPHLPKLEFDLPRRKNRTTEQGKSLPNATRVKLANLLVTHCAACSAALGVAMMLMCGLRTAEAAAVLLGEITMRNGYIVYPVLHQLKDGKRTDILKTESAYRIVVGPRVLQVLIQSRINHLRSLGFTGEEIKRMPLVSRYDDPWSFLDPNQLSAFGKKLLIKAGYTKDAVEMAVALQVSEPDVSAGRN